MENYDLRKVDENGGKMFSGVDQKFNCKDQDFGRAVTVARTYRHAQEVRFEVCLLGLRARRSGIDCGTSGGRSGNVVAGEV